METIFENLLQDMTAVRDTVGDGCEMVIAMSAKVAGKLDLAKGGSHILESGTFQQGSVELKVKELDGLSHYSRTFCEIPDKIHISGWRGKGRGRLCGGSGCKGH